MKRPVITAGPRDCSLADVVDDDTAAVTGRGTCSRAYLKPYNGGRWETDSAEDLLLLKMERPWLLQ